MTWLAVGSLRSAKSDNKIQLTPEKLRVLTFYGWRELRWEDVESIEYGGGDTPFLVVSRRKPSLADRLFLWSRLLVLPHPASFDRVVEYMSYQCPGLLKDVGTDPNKMSKLFRNRLAFLGRYHSETYRRLRRSSAKRPQ